MLVKVNYCYQCGRPVGSQAIKCIYCSAPTRRIIRPERRCPYCDEPIRHKAVKCVHCGEFLDGRPREEKAINAKAAQPTFIIEQAIISPQGLAAPPRPSNLLGAGGGPRGFIEQGSPGQGAARGLPAPLQPEDEDDPLPYIGEQMPGMMSASRSAASGDSVLDVEGSPSDGNLPASASGSRELAPRSSALPSAPSAQSNLPTSYHAPVAPLPPALVAIINYIKGLFFKKAAVDDDTLNIASRSAEDNYRTCMMCQTEILTVDSFCYHCGQQYSVKPFGWGDRTRKGEDEKSNSLLYILIVLSLFGYAYCENLIESFRPEAVKPLLIAFAAAAPMFSFFAFVRKRGFLSRLVGVSFLLVSLLVIIYFLPDAFSSTR